MAMMNEMEYRTIGSALAGGYRAAVYCRLSKDDDLQGESASIANQRDMLEKYCEKQGWEVVAVYQDDGFTGLNMERPDLQRMLRAIERRQINLVITKDLSRLGRNYLQTGHLIEDFFPRNGVRYIAMNDGIDTLRDNNDIAPFKNILNEMYSKDISKKVHSSYLLKAQKGQFTGCLAPFGYRKDPEDKNHLLIDEETAPIVRLIFGYALNGHGPNYIRRRLEEEKIPCPTWWNRERGLRNTRTKWEKKDPENGRYMWDFSVIKDLLMNPVYTGAIASQKKDYRFKIGTIGEKKPEDWIVVEGQHEPLIDSMSFDIVQNKLKSRQRPGQTNEISLFAGLLKCGECGKSLTVRYTNAKHPQRIYSCKTYNAFGKNHCTQHRIDYDTLYSHVLRKIRECARAALMDGEAVADRLTNTCEAEQREQREAMERSLTRDEERIEVLDKMVMRLYEDMIAGRISEQNFNTMLEKTQTEQTELKTNDPWQLTSFLTTLYDDYTRSEVQGKLKETFKKQYKLTTWVEVQTRYRTVVMIDIFTGIPYTTQVPYQYKIFHTKLENRGLEVVIREELTEDQWKRYEIFQDTKGGRPYLFKGGLPAGGSDGSGTPGIDYTVPAEALTDEEFAAIYKEAQKYVGTPYVWGGSTPETGFDCSGYVCWVYNQNGYNVGRTTANGLWNKSQHISEAEAKPGDLVFFEGTYDTPGKSHVGIYLGNGMMVSAGDPIKYADIHSSYWQKYLSGFGRLSK